MPSKKHRPEEIIGKLREAEVVLAHGATTAEACRRIGVTEQTYYRWRKEYGGNRDLLAVSTAPGDALLEPERQSRSRLVPDPKPGELDHCGAQARITGFGNPLFAIDLPTPPG